MSSPHEGTLVLFDETNYGGLEDEHVCPLYMMMGKKLRPKM